MIDAPKKGNLIKHKVINRLFEQVAKYCREQTLSFYWHGGEPLLFGKERFVQIMELQRQTLNDFAITNSVQTNGLLLDKEWIEIFQSYGVGLGVSIDGTQEVHDKYRVDHHGKGTYERVATNSQLAIEAGLSPMCLVVVNPEADGAEAFNNVVNIGFKEIDFLLPMKNWNSSKNPSKDSKAFYNCGVYLVKAYWAWLNRGDKEIYVRLFNSLIASITGDKPECCMMHNNCSNIITVETTGKIALCDDLKPTGSEIYYIGANILENSLPDIKEMLQAKFSTYGISTGWCSNSPEWHIPLNWCPATRFKSGIGFSNRSIDFIAIGMLKNEIANSIASIDTHNVSYPLRREGEKSA
jgi:uncharacterized protein